MRPVVRSSVTSQESDWTTAARAMASAGVRFFPGMCFVCVTARGGQTQVGGQFSFGRARGPVDVGRKRKCLSRGLSLPDTDLEGSLCTPTRAGPR